MEERSCVVERVAGTRALLRCGGERLSLFVPPYLLDELRHLVGETALLAMDRVRRRVVAVISASLTRIEHASWILATLCGPTGFARLAGGRVACLPSAPPMIGVVVEGLRYGEALRADEARGVDQPTPQRGDGGGQRL